jgi:hypothetical protein
LANAQGTTDATAALAVFRQRASRTEVDAAIKMCLEKQWLRLDGATYVLTEAGVKLGSQSRAHPHGRVSPF